jgi:glycosyltransferase involved in cell wall biosynthesis
VAAPLVSVVVTNHNYARFLGDALESALAQEYGPVEVIVVDDDSTDDSGDVLEAYADRVTVLLEHCGGQAAAAAVGFAASAGDVVILLDADDVLLPSAAGRAAAVLDVAGAVKVHWPVETVDASGRALGGRLPLDPLPAGDLREHLLDVGPSAVAFSPTSGNAWTRAFLSRVMPAPRRKYRIGLDAYLAALAPLYGVIDADDQAHSLYRLHPSGNWSALSFFDRLEHDLAVDDVTRRCVADHCALLGIDAAPERWREKSWFRKLSSAIDELAPLIRGRTVALIDEDQWGVDDSVGWTARHFPERDGMYWGLPANDADALAELDRALAAGASRLVVAWSALWWLDYYADFAAALRARFPVLLSTEHVEVFDLTAAVPRK